MVKNKFSLVVFVVAPLLVVGCGNNSSNLLNSASTESDIISVAPSTPSLPTGVDPSSGDLDIPPAIQELSDRAVGMEEEELENEAMLIGATVRVSSRDGKDFALTMDYVSTRLNIKVQDGIVISSSIG